MITFLETDFMPGPPLPHPVASDVALEASVSEALAAAFLGAAWEQAESFTGRNYRGMTRGVVLIQCDGPTDWLWPRYPFPATVSAEAWNEATGAFDPVGNRYKLGRVDLMGGVLYRLTQAPTPAVDPVPANVLQAVQNLALYQLIQMPQRREFRSQQTGDVTLTREALMGIFYGSGAGALLASEVRK